MAVAKHKKICRITINGKDIKQVKQLTFIGSSIDLITGDSRSDTDQKRLNGKIRHSWKQ